MAASRGLPIYKLVYIVCVCVIARSRAQLVRPEKGHCIAGDLFLFCIWKRKIIDWKRGLGHHRIFQQLREYSLLGIRCHIVFRV
jgi:hypothetical protein